MESNVSSLAKDDKGSVFFQTIDHNLYCYTGNNSGSLAPLNNSSSRQHLLLSTQKRLFDFTAFLQHVPDSATAHQRQAIYRELSEHNENFSITDAGRIYLLYQDSIYYYDGRELRSLSRFVQRD